MDPTIFQQMKAVEQNHWWFVARRSIIERVIAKLRLDPNAAILEAGCGSGGNLKMLSNWGSVFAFELDDFAREHAQAVGAAEVLPGKLPDEIPWDSKPFDLITAFDVLEHIQDDEASVGSLASRIKPNGHLLVTVPALQSLWSYHDEQHHHFRRYSRESLMQLIERTQLKIRKRPVGVPL